MTKSLKLNLKLVYQLTHKMMICPSKCLPLNNASTGATVAFCHHRPDRALIIADALLKRGYPARVAEKVLGGNFVRVFGEIW